MEGRVETICRTIHRDTASLVVGRLIVAQVKPDSEEWRLLPEILIISVGILPERVVDAVSGKDDQRITDAFHGLESNTIVEFVYHGHEGTVTIVPI